MYRTYTNSIFINLPPQQVYELLTDPTHIRGWMYTLVHWEWDGDIESGSTFRFSVDNDRFHGGSSAKIMSTGKVLIASPGIEFSYTAESDHSSSTSRYVMTSERDGSRLTHELTITPKHWLLKAIMTYLNFTVASTPRMLLHKLKEYAEADPEARLAIAKRTQI